MTTEQFKELMAALKSINDNLKHLGRDVAEMSRCVYDGTVYTRESSR